MIIGSDLEKIGYSGETKDDGFGEVPIEDDGSFVLERDMPVDTRDLVHPSMRPRIDYTKSTVGQNLRAINDMTSEVFHRFERHKNIKNLQISVCKSKCTFLFSGIDVCFKLIGLGKFSVNDTPIDIANPDNPNVLEDMCMTLFQKELQRVYHDCAIEKHTSYLYSNRITISEVGPASTYLSENKVVNLTIHLVDSSIKLWGDSVDDKEFKFKKFLKNLGKHDLGIKKIEK